MDKILITGVAGFIGFHSARRFLEQGHEVIGVDNLNSYYDVGLKRARLALLRQEARFTFHTLDISDFPAVQACLGGQTLSHILHLAAQAGVRYSLEHPRAYMDANIIGHFNMLELVRQMPEPVHLVYASSSSVYGVPAKAGPFRETDVVRHPESLYAATKLSAEILSESYARLHEFKQTGLRFFTVYGPWGRPDMAYFIFVDKILRGQPVTLYGDGRMRRDFTFIEDIVAVLPKILMKPPASGHEIYNLGRGQPHEVRAFLQQIMHICGRTVLIEQAPVPKGDVGVTFANIEAAQREFDFAPTTGLDTGLRCFVDWYKAYYYP